MQVRYHNLYNPLQKPIAALEGLAQTCSPMRSPGDRRIRPKRTWSDACKRFSMTMPQRCQRYLKQIDVLYAHSIHAPAFTAPNMIRITILDSLLAMFVTKAPPRWGVKS
jgi:hypothetical protein